MPTRDCTLEKSFDVICERIRDRSDVLTRLLDTLEAKEVYEELFPETRRGAAPGLPGGGKAAKTATVAGFVTAIAEKTFRKERTVFLDVEIALGLSPDTCTRLRRTPIATQTTTLKALSKLPPEQQHDAIDVYEKRKAAKGEVEGESALKLSLRPPKAPEPPAIVTELDEPLPIGGEPLDASLLGSIVRFRVAGGRLHAKVLGPDQALPAYRWPSKPESTPTTTGNWTMALHHAASLLAPEARAMVDVGPVEVVAPTYCKACGESRFLVERRALRDTYLAEGRDPPFGWMIEGRSRILQPRLGIADPPILSTRRDAAGTTLATVEEGGERKEHRLFPRRGWPEVITTGACSRCSRPSKPVLTRDLAVPRHRVTVSVATPGRAPLSIAATIWPSEHAAGSSYGPGLDTPVLLFEVEGEQWERFYVRGGGAPVFYSLSALAVLAKSLFADVVGRAREETLRLA